ncbi:MAG: adenylate kinase [Acidobacteriota bacterium]
MAGDGKKAHLIFLGPPGSGKGTQSEFVCKALGIPQISTGDMLRAAVAAGSELGQKVESIMNSGALVSDELIAEVVKDRLVQADAQEGFLLDGYPRTGPQAETLSGILEESGIELDHVVLIDVPEEELVARAVARGRDDDKEEVVRERQRVYHEKTAPLIDYYRAQGLIREIDGNRPIEDVTAALMEAIGA